MEFATDAPLAFVILPLMLVFILINIRRAGRGADLYIRRVPGIDAIDEVVGRAVELGRPILFSFGLGGIDIVTLQAMTVMGYVCEIAGRFRTRVITPTVDPVAIPVIEEIMREGYATAGAAEAFDADDIRFLSGQQFAYAAGVVGIMNREQVGANFFFGYFYAESLIMAESGQNVGAVQIAATPAQSQIPFFIATCDYTIIGEEYYAVTALLSNDPVLKGSLVGQDYTKMMILALILVGFTTLSVVGSDSDTARWLGHLLVPASGG